MKGQTYEFICKGMLEKGRKEGDKSMNGVRERKNHYIHIHSFKERRKGVKW